MRWRRVPVCMSVAHVCTRVSRNKMPTSRLLRKSCLTWPSAVLSVVYAHVYAHVYTHVYTHVDTHVDTNGDTHGDTHGYTHVDTHVYTHVDTHVYTHVDAHVYTHAWHLTLPSAVLHAVYRGGRAVPPTT